MLNLKEGIHTKMIKIKRGTTVNKKALSLAICLAMAIPTASNALSLGDIESKSSLNQPFQGKINLLQTNPSEVQNLRIRVASPEVFNRVGIDRPAFLNSIRFRTAVQNGRPVILVSSNQPINEPFLNFLLEVSWPNGQLLKEYTVLLDPPVLLRPNTAIASNNAGVRAEPRAQGVINRAPQPTQQQIQAQRQRQAQQAQRQRQVQQQRQAEQQRQAQLQRQAQQRAQGESSFERQARQVLQGQTQQASRVAAAPSRRSASNNYRVRRGDTLSKIAARLNYSGVQRDQMMVALFEKNRNAFSQGNMNNLKAGAVMARPSLQEARSLSSRAAKSQIVAQARAWKAKRGEQIASRGGNSTDNANSARLEVLGGKNNASSSSSSGNSAAISDLNQKIALLNESLTTKQQENTELKSRVSELESLLRKKNRLIALKSEQLASLQSGIGGSTERTPQTAQTQDPQVTQAQTNTAVENIGNDIQGQVAGQLASENNEIVRTTPETAIVDTQATGQLSNQVEPEIEIDVTQQEQAADPFKSEEEAGMDIMGLINSPVGWAAGAGSLALLGGFAFMRRRKNKGEVEDFSDLIDSGLSEQEIEEDYVTSEFNHDGPEFEEAEEEVSYEQSDIQSQEAAAVLDSSDELEDLIQEADVYIVYGLHDQAESEIKRALMTYPDSAALHAKLLENYKAAGDAESFEEATKDFINLKSDDKQEHWEEICEWGNALLPESKLYDSSSLPGIGSVATGAAMVAGTAVAASSDAAEDVFDKAEDLFSTDADEDSLIEDTILDEFDEVDLSKEFDELEGLDLDTDIDLGEVAEASDSLEFDNSLDLDESLDIDTDQETHLDLEDDVKIADLADDFEIDLDDDFDNMLDDSVANIGDAVDNVKSEAVDKVADVADQIEDTDFLFDDDSLEDILNADEDKDNGSSIAGMAAAGAAAAGLAAKGLMGGDEPAEKEIDISDAANLNLEIGAEDFDKLIPEENAYKSNPDGEVSGIDDNLLADFDDNLSFLDLDDDAEVIGETQIETKIDLAKAYIDMGDIDGARSTLEEVMESGNDEQKRLAEELLHQNG